MNKILFYMSYLIRRFNHNLIPYSLVRTSMNTYLHAITQNMSLNPTNI